MVRNKRLGCRQRRPAQGVRLEYSGSMDIAKHVLLACGVVLATGVLAGFAAQKLRLPDVVVFLVAGLLLGPPAPRPVSIRADSALNQIILIFGSCYILFDGGASLRFKVLKSVWITITALATLGVLVTAVVAAGSGPQRHTPSST